jgi:hypothetical protein
MAHSIYDINQAIAEKAAGDEDFRNWLSKDPKGAVQEAVSKLAGREVQLPDDLEVVVHQNSPNQVHVVLPSAGDESVAKVSADDLQSAGYALSPTYIKCE